MGRSVLLLVIGELQYKSDGSIHSQRSPGGQARAASCAEPSGLQLLNRQVGIAYSHAQFVSERGEQLDRDVGLLLAQPVEMGCAEFKAGQSFIDGNERPMWRPSSVNRTAATFGDPFSALH